MILILTEESLLSMANDRKYRQIETQPIFKNGSKFLIIGLQVLIICLNIRQASNSSNKWLDIFQNEYESDKKVLLRERKMHTNRGVSSTPSVSQGGVPPLAGYPPARSGGGYPPPGLMGGTPPSSGVLPPAGITPSQV